jgi:Putative zinc-finger
MNKADWVDDHQKFRELAALSLMDELSESEQLELKRHLQDCRSCQQAYEEYALISTEGMGFLATAYGYEQRTEDWDDRAVGEKLLARVQERAQEAKPSLSYTAKLSRIGHAMGSRRVAFSWTTLAAAACVLFALTLGAYHYGSHRRTPGQLLIASSSPAQNPLPAKEISSPSSGLQTAQISKLEAQVASDQQEIARLRTALHTVETHADALSAANAIRDAQFQQVSEQRDKLVDQLREAEKSYEFVQTELTNLRAERDRAILRVTSLESKVDELTAYTHDQEQRLKDSEQYLASDRDIRELMGARKLYIADVFDVDSGSRARKPFGRVFYTQSKSLIFYAFDLDRQPGVKTASSFQVWGKRDAESGAPERATNLGILYLDSETNRRWVLRLDDPKQLAELDAVFVTVEPNGGSQKPTGKPFLYALLRREANHP